MLAKGRALRHVKAWGIRSAGSLSEVIVPAHGREGGQSLPSSASSLRRVFATKGVELDWAGPLGESGDDGGYGAVMAGRETRWGGRGAENNNAEAFGGGASGRGEGGGEGDEEPAAAEAWAEAEVEAVEGRVEDGPRHSCRLGCGAWPKSGDSVDHLEVGLEGFVT